MSGSVGDVAIEEEQQEYYRGHIFDAADHDRTITCRGTLIIIYDPNAAKGTTPYWKYKVPTQDAEHDVPAGYEVKVIDAWVKLTK
ncbi:hypothetical protein BDZ45DRAFT_204755 [Acephala macrosclerotiorum]|nr:hypothetical protein BDZ45DRAFT_204755 [Acephala macrosclerotiorum]